ncbi:MAG: hypothetical protein RLN69_10640 [Woeseiaceae bacterium]
MTLKKSLRLLGGIAAISAALSTPLLADDESTLPFASEVDSCLAAVNANLDLSNANRVRHIVKQRDRTGQAFAFAIETSVFTENDVTRYAAYCVASGDRAPSRFRIAQQGS